MTDLPQLSDSSPAVPNAHTGYHNEERDAINASTTGLTAETAARIAADAALVVSIATKLDNATVISDALIPSGIARDAEVTAAVNAAVAALVNASPGTLDTLAELATALGNDPAFVTTITNLIGTKISTSIYNANTILAATTDDIPAPVTVAEQTIVGRITGGNIAALTGAQCRTLLGLVIGTDVAAFGDARLSDTRTPTDGTITAPKFATNVLDVDSTFAANSDTRIASQKAVKTALALKESLANKNVANGYLGLDASGKALLANLPTGLSTLGFGAHVTGGHSYSQVGGNSAAGGDYVNISENFMRRMAAFLRVPNAYSLGRSGAQLCGPTAGDTADTSGLGLWARWLSPRHGFAPRATGATSTPARGTAKSFGALFSFIYGVNEPLRIAEANGSTGIATATFIRHLTTLITWVRAAVRVDSRDTSYLTYSGFATIVATSDSGHAGLSCSGPSWRKSSTNGDTFTIQLPDELPIPASGSLDWFVTLIGPTNTQTYIAAAGVASGATTVVFRAGPVFAGQGYKILTAGDVVVCQNEKITLGSTADGGITWTGCTRTFAQALAANASVAMPTDTIRVTWGGTSPVAAATATTYLCGIGLGTDGVYVTTTGVQKSPGFITIRFALTAADAGKTIVGTVAGKTGNEFVGFDSTGFADPSPPVVQLFDQPDAGGTIPGPGSLFSGTVATPLNDALSTVAAAFDSQVVVVAMNTEIRARFYGTVQTAISATGTTTLKITPNDVARCEITNGAILRVLGSAAVETMRVTGIDKTNAGANDGTWLLTVGRNFDAGGAQTTIAVGKPVLDRRWLSLDFVHPSDYGHNIYAAKGLESLTALSRTFEQATNSGGLKTISPRLKPLGIIPLVRAAGRSTQSMVNGMEYAFPFEVRNSFVIVRGILVPVATGVASTTLRAAIRADGPGIPGNLIGEMDTTPVMTASTTVVEATGWVRLDYGVYWAVVQCQGATHTAIRGAVAANLTPSPHPIAVDPDTATTAFATYGYLAQGATSGGMSQAFPTASAAPMSIANVAPVVPFIRLDCPTYD